jgi:hypothetical protein
MAGPAKSKPGRALATALGGVVLAQVLLVIADGQHWLDRFHDRWVAMQSVEGASRVHYLVDRAFHATQGVAEVALGTALLSSFVLVVLGFVARILARASVRAGRPDPLDRVRQWTTAHPRRTRALFALVCGAWALSVARDRFVGDEGRPTLDFVLAGANALALSAAGGWFLSWLAGRAGAALLAPTLEESAPRATTSGKSEISFDAVAVTTETRSAVYGMIGANLAMMAWLASLSTHALYHDSRVAWVVGAFAVSALGGAALFRRASKVAVGVDGVRVQGTSRTRFYAYRDLDAARLNRTDIELVRKDRVVLRLQLHGEDAARRGAVLDRIRSAIDRVKEGRAAVAAQMVSTAHAEDLASAAGGGANYRGAALTRDQIWALVEGPEIDSTARRSAAEALAKTSDEADRARLHVAAERCAAPEVRVAIERLAEEEVEHTSGTERRARALPERSDPTGRTT